MRFLAVGDDGANSVTVPVLCPRCEHPVRTVKVDDRRGLLRRERKMVLECCAPKCRWAGVLMCELVDLHANKARGGA